MINKYFMILLTYIFFFSYTYSYDWGAWPDTSKTTTPLAGESGHPHSYQQRDDLGYRPSSDLAFPDPTSSYIPTTEQPAMPAEAAPVIPSHVSEPTIPSGITDRQEGITTPRPQFPQQRPELDEYTQPTVHREQISHQATEQQEQYPQQQMMARTQPSEIASAPQQQDTAEPQTTPHDTSGKSLLSGIGTALTALESLKHHKDPAEHEEASESKIASSTTQISGSPKIVTKNFSCNKAPAQCQKEWNDLVNSIESNPQYEILTKKMSCDTGIHNIASPSPGFITTPGISSLRPRLPTPGAQQSRPLPQPIIAPRQAQDPQIPTSPEARPTPRQQA